LGVGVWALAGHLPTGIVISSVRAGEQASAAARDDLNRVTGPGVDLVANDPKKAEGLLKDAIAQLNSAGTSGIAASTIAPIRAQAVGLLDRLYKMVDVLDQSIFAFPAATPVDLTSIVQGPDGFPYVIDAASQSVYRIDLIHNKAQAIFRQGNRAKGAVEGAPKLITDGVRDLVIVDSKNVVWKWRPANSTGTGTLNRVHVLGSAEWGDDILQIGTFVRNADSNLYNLYVIDPSAQAIWAYSPAADGSGSYPSAPTNRLATARPVDDVTAMYIDGDIWLAEAGSILRLVGGKSEGWQASLPGDDVLRSAPSYTLVTSGSPRRAGTIYGFDPANLRVIALTKAGGAYIDQFRLANGSTAWQGLKGWYVEPGVSDAPDAIVWIDGSSIHRTILEASTSASGSPAPSGSTEPSGSTTPSSSTRLPSPSH
ncbi:MAG TPA: hypothetical protein VF484_10105, partial [Candidatus Limnocylindrales bacterium]